MPTRLTTLEESDDAGDLRDSTTPEERWAMTWELSQNLYEFTDKTDIDQSQNRQIVRIIKRQQTN